jgi:hypothetical protein
VSRSLRPLVLSTGPQPSGEGRPSGARRLVLRSGWSSGDRQRRPRPQSAMPWSCPWPSWGIDRSNLIGTLSDSASASRQFGPTGLGWPQARYTCTVKSRMVQPVLPRRCEQSRDHRPAYSSAARSTLGTSTPVATPSRSKVAHSTSAARSRPRRRARRAHRRSAALRSAGPTPSSPRRARGSGARGTPPEPRCRSHRPVPRWGLRIT